MNSASGIPIPSPTLAPVVRPPLTGAGIGVVVDSGLVAPVGCVDVLDGRDAEFVLVVASPDLEADADAELDVGVAARKTGKSEDCHITTTPFANAHEGAGNTLGVGSGRWRLPSMSVEGTM